MWTEIAYDPAGMPDTFCCKGSTPDAASIPGAAEQGDVYWSTAVVGEFWIVTNKDDEEVMRNTFTDVVWLVSSWPPAP